MTHNCRRRRRHCATLDMPPPLGFHRVADAIVDASTKALALDDGESIELQCRADVVIGALESEPATKTGSLFVTTARVVFCPDDDDNAQPLAMNYQSIALHAVSRADAPYAARGCVYCHIDGGADGAPATERDDDDEDASVEVRFVPHEPTTVDAVFTALSACAELNPDTDDDDDDDDDDDTERGGGYYYDEASALADDVDGSIRAALDSYDDKLVMPSADELDALLAQPGRFDDAEA